MDTAEIKVLLNKSPENETCKCSNLQGSCNSVYNIKVENDVDIKTEIPEESMTHTHNCEIDLKSKVMHNIDIKKEHEDDVNMENNIAIDRITSNDAQLTVKRQSDDDLCNTRKKVLRKDSAVNTDTEQCQYIRRGEKIYESYCNVHIKEEVCEPAREKQKCINSNSENVATTVNNTCNSSKQTYTCKTCYSAFTEKQALSAHLKNCGKNQPIVKTPQNNGVKCQECKHGQNNFKVHDATGNGTLLELIENVRNHPCLYNSEDDNYKNVHFKDDIWASIAEQCNYSNGTAAKAAWETLKDNFRDELKRQNNTCSGQARNHLKPWEYRQQMQFISPYMSNRDVTNIHNEHSNDGDANNEAPASAVAEIDDDAEDNHSVIQMAPSIKTTRTASPNNEILNVLDINLRSRDDLEGRSQPREEMMHPATSSRAIDLFFMSMCETTKSLPQHLQLQIKKKIFEVVLEAEEITNSHAGNNLSRRTFSSPSNAVEERFPNISPYTVFSTVANDN